jgi:hypothetical protein
MDLLILALYIAGTIVIGLILVWAVDRFVPDGRLRYLLRILIFILIAIAILQRLSVLFGLHILP